MPLKFNKYTRETLKTKLVKEIEYKSILRRNK